MRCVDDAKKIEKFGQAFEKGSSKKCEVVDMSASVHK
jgi:hypothetical protein